MYHSLIYHDRTDLAVLLSGATKHGWSFDLRDVWTYRPPSGEWRSIGTCLAISEKGDGFTGAVYNRKHNVVILFNVLGETWAFHLESSTWRNMQPPASPSPRVGQGLAYDSESDRVILFGGFRGSKPNDPPLDDTWAYDYSSNTWSLGRPKERPSARMYAAMAYEAKADRVVLWGGRRLDPIADNGVWAYDFNSDTWTSRIAAGGPEKILAYPAMVYLPKPGKMFMFGGTLLTAPFEGTPANETWTYDLSREVWELLKPPHRPPAAAIHTMVYDPKLRQVILFGGETGRSYSNNVLGDVWVFDCASMDWHKK